MATSDETAAAGRRVQGLGQAEMAAGSVVDLRRIRDIEADRVEPDGDTIAAVAVCREVRSAGSCVARDCQRPVLRASANNPLDELRAPAWGAP